MCFRPIWFPSNSLEFGMYSAGGTMRPAFSNKNIKHSVTSGLTWTEALGTHYWIFFFLLEKEANSMWTLTEKRKHGRTSWVTYPDLTCIFSPCWSCPISFHWNKSPHKYDYMLSSSSTLLNVWMALVIPSTPQTRLVLKNQTFIDFWFC